jgi:hypothetical protein
VPERAVSSKCLLSIRADEEVFERDFEAVFEALSLSFDLACALAEFAEGELLWNPGSGMRETWPAHLWLSITSVFLLLTVRPKLSQDDKKLYLSMRNAKAITRFLCRPCKRR